MQSTNPPTAKTRAWAVIGAGFAGLLIIAAGLLLREYGPGNMGNGFLVGGALSLVALGIVFWRVAKKPHSATTFERGFSQLGDERDDDILTRAFAVMGACSIPLISVATVILALEIHPAPVMLSLLAVHFIIGVVAFRFINNRR